MKKVFITILLLLFCRVAFCQILVCDIPQDTIQQSQIELIYGTDTARIKEATFGNITISGDVMELMDLSSRQPGEYQIRARFINADGVSNWSRTIYWRNGNPEEPPRPYFRGTNLSIPEPTENIIETQIEIICDDNKQIITGTTSVTSGNMQLFDFSSMPPCLYKIKVRTANNVNGAVGPERLWSPWSKTRYWYKRK